MLCSVKCSQQEAHMVGSLISCRKRVCMDPLDCAHWCDFIPTSTALALATRKIAAGHALSAILDHIPGYNPMCGRCGCRYTGPFGQ